MRKTNKQEVKKRARIRGGGGKMKQITADKADDGAIYTMYGTGDSVTARMTADGVYYWALVDAMPTVIDAVAIDTDTDTDAN